MARRNAVLLYTDGSFMVNLRNRGGWAAVLVFPCGSLKVRQGQENQTTNNRMELTAVIEGLRDLKCLSKKFKTVEVYSDSTYIVKTVNTKRLYRWLDSEWKKTNGKEIKNSDLWKELLCVMEGIDITFKHVKSHSGDLYNELADSLAKEACLHGM